MAVYVSTKKYEALQDIAANVAELATWGYARAGAMPEGMWVARELPSMMLSFVGDEATFESQFALDPEAPE